MLSKHQLVKPPPAPIGDVRVSTYQIPTDAPESDGTLEWDHTTMVLVEIYADGHCGMGYTYAHEAAALIIKDLLIPCLQGQLLSDHRKLWSSMIAAVRNLGPAGLCAMAISAVDNALWDLCGKLLEKRLIDLFPNARQSVPVYGSGGFTSYDEATLQDQLEGWAATGMNAVKMKVGRDPDSDPARVQAARKAIRDEVALFVDANNAYPDALPALAWAQRFVELANVSWLEQPLIDTDTGGMAMLCREAPASIAIADGEYGFTPDWFKHHLEAKAAHVFQPDITRCLGLTGFLYVLSLCKAYEVPVSTHCAPALHATAGCLSDGLLHVEYFHDHVRIERSVFEGSPIPDATGSIRPSDRHGFGLVFKPQDARRMAKEIQ